MVAMMSLAIRGKCREDRWWARYRTGLRGLLLLPPLAALLLLPVAKPWHMGRVHHVACPEHQGESVHVGDATREVVPKVASIGARHGAKGAGAHEHCTAASSATLQGVSPRAAWEPGAPLAMLDVVPRGEPSAPFVTRPVYSFAPKQSPTLH